MGSLTHMRMAEGGVCPMDQWSIQPKVSLEAETLQDCRRMVRCIVPGFAHVLCNTTVREIKYAL